MENFSTSIRPPSGFSLGLKELWQYRELFYFFTWRDIKVKYKQTYLGVLWALIQPLGMMLLFTFIFSRTLKSTNWDNSRIVRTNPVEEVKRMKKENGSDLTVLGSGTIVTQLAENNLIDTYMLMVDPVVLGEGTPIFQGIKHQPDLKLIDTRKFKSGVVLLTYNPK